MDRSNLNVPHIRRALAAPAAGSSDYDLNPDAPRPGRQPLRPASVLVPLVERGSGVNLILTRRAALLKHHPGQVAFPGGKQEPGDATPLAAALREAEEEIALRPAQVEVLGGLDPHETVTSFAVRPFVGLVDPGFRPAPDPGEVEEVFEVPLAFVLCEENRQLMSREYNGRRRHFYAYPFGDYFIWGATAGMLNNLAEVLSTLERA
jgi:8-oxo-dGTP pyrophosphatase MutT (NUDIX family)